MNSLEHKTSFDKIQPSASSSSLLKDDQAKRITERVKRIVDREDRIERSNSILAIVVLCAVMLSVGFVVFNEYLPG